MRIEPDSEDAMRRLLQRSRSVPPLDADRMANTRETVHRAWRDATERRARRWWWAGAAAALVAVATMYGLLRQPAASGSPAGTTLTTGAVASVQFVAGSIQVRDGLRSTDRQVRSGDYLAADAVIATASGRGTLVLRDGVEVRLDQHTTVKLEDDHRFTLEGGALYVDTTPRQEAGLPVQVHARGAVISDVGTRYEVRMFEDRVRVRVRDGLVQVRRGIETHRTPAASELSMTSAEVRVARTPAFGADWDWIVQATGAPRVEGRSLAEFLAWVARESGREIRFEDRAIERSASSIVVYATVEGLTIDEALDIVLPSCGLTHRIDGGTLTIAALPDSRGPR